MIIVYFAGIWWDLVENTHMPIHNMKALSLFAITLDMFGHFNITLARMTSL
jgi:hypothetical protein